MKLIITTITAVLLTGCESESDFSDKSLNKHGVIYHACCEANPCCGMENCCDLKEKESGEACKNTNCVKISNKKRKEGKIEN